MVVENNRQNVSKQSISWLAVFLFCRLSFTAFAACLFFDSAGFPQVVIVRHGLLCPLLYLPGAVQIQD
jgi:hypothetical protein